jgi:hypothetical protein
MCKVQEVSHPNEVRGQRIEDGGERMNFILPK